MSLGAVAVEGDEEDEALAAAAAVRARFGAIAEHSRGARQGDNEGT